MYRCRITGEKKSNQAVAVRPSKLGKKVCDNSISDYSVKEQLTIKFALDVSVRSVQFQDGTDHMAQISEDHLPDYHS